MADSLLTTILALPGNEVRIKQCFSQAKVKVFQDVQSKFCQEESQSYVPKLMKRRTRLAATFKLPYS